MTSTAATAQRVLVEIRDFMYSLEAALNTERPWHTASLIASLQGIPSELGSRGARLTQRQLVKVRNVLRSLKGPTEERSEKIAGTPPALALMVD